ncbi:arylsulfatase D isoform X2 [Nematostella vectensis]|uniref:arylsulfatase D isoform X2 n=1 Tax=Nematostella vectensis TaxID=45351 RepID=UPI0020772FEF|nr:arylsulfatase D isoform X2 [Nematostella vectensis]
MYSAVKIQIAGLMLILLAVLVLPCSAKQRPNIVILLVDDLGIADIGCFGNDTIRTPHIDKLAREGAALRHNLSPAPICTPSRAAFMTGRYAVRLGMAAKPEECEVFVHNAASGGLPQNETTFAELLSGNGYMTDHGPHLHQFNQKGKNIGGWKGNFRGGKGNNWEGGIRVPTLVRWPSHIESGINITEPTNNFDIFSTIADMTGIPEPADRIIDGKSLLPLLTKQEEYSAHEFMYHYCGKDIHAVRYRPKRGKSIWKAVFKTPNPAFFDVLDEYKLYGCYGDKLITHKPTLLFDLTADPSESNPFVPTKPHYNEIMKHINKAIKHHQDTIAQVPNQLSKNIWYPWLQVCCNFPLCSCVENNTEFVYPKLT